jgi:hypothetical protein
MVKRAAGRGALSASRHSDEFGNSRLSLRMITPDDHGYAQRTALAFVREGY